MDTRLELQPGTVIDHRYRVIGRVGQGGFAEVYEAEHITLERPAALKVLDTAGGARDDNFIRRFQREAKIAANFEHPNVVRIFDFGVVQESQRPYIAMELLQGWDLDVELRKNGAMHPFRAQKLFAGCLDALAQAHQQGIIHKDLKPANLFLQHPGEERERLVIMDFGIARLMDDGQLTQTGAFAGTPAYLAPEYIQDQEVTPAFDVYQMGLIFIEALSGQAVVRANSSVAYLMKHVQGEHDVPNGIRTSQLGPALLRAIDVNPRVRFGDAGEFLEALSKIELPHVPTGDFQVADLTSGTQPMPSVSHQSHDIVPTANTEDSLRPPVAHTPTPAAPRTETVSATPLVPQVVPPRRKRKKKSSALPVFLYLSAFFVFCMFALFMLGLVLAVLEDTTAVDAPAEPYYQAPE